ncbi:C-C chemokine receptor type 8-like [Ctenopharyngodon idella]|uniref:C-C chemokine receptor type 8-like n=1 Tax=Ctenopharyngodon idella TaxID=7959 RepID=UPI00222E6235|nr:C-C chemokine receptor type 8-like [Ctenopharyngodon idella]
MNNSTVNLTTPEASYSFELADSRKICVFSISFLLGLPTHSYVIWLIITGTGSRVASEFFFFNLSVCEIGNSLNSMFGLLSYLFSSFTILTHFLQGLGITGRPLFQCLMCFECYLAVVHPVTFLKYKPLRYRVMCCTAAWIITLGSCLFCIFTLLSFNIEPYIWFFSTAFLFFLSIQLFCLVTVLRALKQSGPGERKRERGEENHMKRRAFYLILITTINLIIQYMPFTITGFFVILAQKDIFVFWFPAFLCYVLAGFVQPVLYLQRAGKLFCLCSS